MTLSMIGYCQAQPKLKLQLGCAGSIPSFSVRPTRIVLFDQNRAFLSKAKLLALMVRPLKYIQTLTLLVMGAIQPYLSPLAIWASIFQT